MSKTLNFLKTFLPKLNSLIDSELRIEGSSKFVKSTYICGYNEILDISILIKRVNEGKILYKIEHLGHTPTGSVGLSNQEYQLNSFLSFTKERQIFSKSSADRII